MHPLSELPSVDGYHTFGGESDRETLWGNELVREYGADLLCALAERSELIVTGMDLDVLEREANVLKTQAKAIAEKIYRASTDDEVDRYTQRILRNMNHLLRSIETARHADCGVWIS